MFSLVPKSLKSLLKSPRLSLRSKWVGSRAGLNVSEKIKLYTGNRNAFLSIVQPVALSALLFICLKQRGCEIADIMCLKEGLVKPGDELGLLKQASRFLD